MKLVRTVITLLFAAAVLAWGGMFLYDKIANDHTAPVITSESDVIRISVNADENELLKGLTASDNRDGDLTSEILIGRHSKFISEGICNVTYIVFDSSNNVGEYTRRVEYTDYKKPEFSLKAPLMFRAGEKISMFQYMGLTDCLDGDISSKLKIIVNDIDSAAIGTYNVTFQAANGYADVVTQSLPVNIVNDANDAPLIELTDYLIYVNVGDKVEPEKYIKSVTDKFDENSDISGVTAVSAVDTKSAGVHQVKYEYKGQRGLVGHTYLTVIVREG